MEKVLTEVIIEESCSFEEMGNSKSTWADEGEEEQGVVGWRRRWNLGFLIEDWAMFNASESFKGLKNGGSITMAEWTFNL